MKKIIALIIATVLVICSFACVAFADVTETNKVYCDTADEIEEAMRLAKAGDEIIIAPGKYILTRGHTKGALAYSASEGTEDKHIIVRSEDPNNLAELCGSDVTTRYVMYITGDYWEIRDLRISTGKKGIVLDNSNYSVIDNCEVYNIGEEGIHIRDNSCYNVISNTKVHDTGLYKPQYGEGIYIGSYYGETNYGREVHYNTITGCYLGPDIAAEHIDIKEGTIGTIVEYCTMYGEGILGENYADSFIDAKGNDAHIRFNKCYRQDNDIIVDCFQVHVPEEGAGQNNKFYGNTYYTNETETNIITANKQEGIAYYYNNVRDIAGNEYNKNCVLDESLAEYFEIDTDTDEHVYTETDVPEQIVPDNPFENENETEIETEIETETDMETETDVSTETESDIEISTESDTDVVTDVETEIETEIETDSETNVDTENGTDTDTDDETEFLLGDINADLNVDIIDAVLLRSHIVKNRILSNDEFLRADVNVDGSADIIDIVMIRRVIIGG